MKSLRGFLALVFVLGLVFGRPLSILAEEAGAKDDPSALMAASEQAGGMAPMVAETDEVSILTEAAAALDATHPELAAKLRALAVNEHSEKGEANEPAEQ